MKATSTDPARDKAYAAGKAWFRSLSERSKGELGDALVLGYYDWTEWLDEKPARGFMSGVEAERLCWESEGAGLRTPRSCQLSSRRFG
jgi:hypothetical protein